MMSANPLGLSIARLLGTEEALPRERYQEPTLQQTKRGVWFIRPWVDVIKGGKVTRAKKTITIGTMGKREAAARAREIMATINRADYVVTSQIRLEAFLEEYMELHVKRLAVPSQEMYESLVRVHIKPAFGKLMLCEITPLLVQQWLNTRPLSWAKRRNLRSIMSGIFEKAAEWGRWKETNPIEHVDAGRKKVVRQQRKFTDEEIRRVLAQLPEVPRLLACTQLFTTLSISEALGLQEKHLDFEHGLICVRQRFWRGDLDATKTERRTRDVPMGYLAADLKRICLGDPERFVFQIPPPTGRRPGKNQRADWAWLQRYLRPAAQAVGCYWKGFGWHSLRREAVTAANATMGVTAAMRLAGHTSVAMSGLYTLADLQAQDAFVRARQEAIMGKDVGKVQ
jgi:integrase